MNDESANNESLEEQIAARMEDAGETASRARHFALIALVVTGLAVYGGWRLRHREHPVAAGSTVTAINFDLRDVKNRSESFLPETVPATAALPDIAPLPPLSEMPAPSAPVKKTDEYSLAASNDTAGQTVPPASLSGAQTTAVLPPLPIADDVLPSNPDSETFTAPLLPAAPAINAAPAADNPQTAATAVSGNNPSSNMRVHVITEDDSLPGLAQQYYGEASTANIIRIRNANPQLKAGGFRAGVRLQIPAVSNSVPQPSVSAASLPAAAAPERTQAAAGEYTVRAGDTLARIAAKLYGRPAAWRNIYAMNRDRLSAPDKLHAGMRLRVPALSEE